MRTKIKTFLFVVFLTGIIIFHANAQCKNDTLIYWEKNQKLQWRDFHGKVPQDCGKDKARSSLIINTTFINRENLLDAKVLCVFNKNNSWVKDPSLSLLNHEQLHFDITELFARKIRKGISILRNTNQTNNEEYTKLVKVLLKEYNVFNVQYDEETAHSINKLKQIEWEYKIAKELEELKDYEVD
jgi:hypothetical protein